MREISLREGWRLREAPLDWQADALNKVLACADGWMACSLPCDVHMPLEAYGRIADVVVADNCYHAEWIEKRSWWFAREIEVSADDMEAEIAELTLESLDARADVFLNGTHLGTHISAHYPFHRDVKEWLRPGANTLVVRLTTGLETVTDQSLAELHWAVSMEEGNGHPDRSDARRAMVRKPQYTVGWDWGPKALTCGIVKGAYLRFGTKVVVRDVHICVLEATQGHALLKMTLEIVLTHPFASADGDAFVCLALGGLMYNYGREGLFLTSGLNYVDLQLEVPGARLWWPAGYGEQPLYDVGVWVKCGEVWDEYPIFRYGIRTVDVNVSHTDATRRRFTFVVNDVEVFCKGGDWIPADSIYARVSDEKYLRLVDEARQAGFNMLRVWGGGIYERDIFYEACDRAGILLWHDFMFGCAAYPDHLDWFRREVASELDYQIRRLRNHACIGIFCGNNEDHWLVPGWHALDVRYQRQYGLWIGNELAREKTHCLCPEIPYWNSSPYGGEKPNGDDVGDVHHWDACMMNPKMEKRIEPKEYDKIQARFVSEYGYPGPCPLASIRQYLGGEPDMQSALWRLHTNTFEKDTVAAGIRKHYGVDAAELSLEEYLLYAGLVQSLMLEYSLEAMRFLDFCSGALFWMYNDTWGEMGWTIIDYYLRRKISYYGVKRAFAPVKLTLRLIDGKAVLRGANDTPNEVTVHAKVGYLPFDGTPGEDMRDATFCLPPRARTELAVYALPQADFARGAFTVLPTGSEVAPAVLRMGDACERKLAEGEARVLDCREKEGGVEVTLTSDVFLHAVHADIDNEMSDQYFDLLPGQVKTVWIQGAGESPEWRAVR